MLEPIVVNAPTIFPWKCVQCGSQTGPLVDTNVELAGGMRVYHCASCVRINGIKLGLIDGQGTDKKLHTGERLAAVEKDLEQANTRIAKQADEAKRAKRQIGELNGALEWATQRIEQLEAAITEDAKARLAVVEA